MLIMVVHIDSGYRSFFVGVDSMGVGCHFVLGVITLVSVLCLEELIADDSELNLYWLFEVSTKNCIELD